MKMKFTYFLTAMIMIVAISVISCKKSSTDLCTNTNITIQDSVTKYTGCPTAIKGSITITASGSSGYTYNIDGGAYQSSNVFSNLLAGTYTVGVKDANGCSNTKSIVVGETAGPNFINVRTIIRNNCGGSSCHLNGGSQKGYNFDNECSIVSSWSKINSTCVTLQSMPTSGPLSSADRQAITTWVTNGHTYTN